MGLRSPRLPHAKGVLYQMSYDPKSAFVFFYNFEYNSKMSQISFEKEEKTKIGGSGFRSPCLTDANGALYQLS